MTFVFCHTGLRPELLKADNSVTPHRVRVRRGKRKATDGRLTGRNTGEERAGWLLWLLQRMTLADAAVVVGLTYKGAWNIAHGLTHPLTEPRKPPEDVWTA